MADRNGTVTLKAFVKKTLMKWGKDPSEEHRMHIIAADCLKKFYTYDLPIASETQLTINATYLTADYPDDYVDYIQISIERDGKWWSFTRNDDMVDKTNSYATGSDLSAIVSMYGYGHTGGRNDWYFKPDNKNKRFIFSGITSSSTVVLQYIGSGVAASLTGSSSTGISFPIYVEEPLEDALRWKLAEYDTRIPPSEKERLKRNYEESLIMMRNLDSPTIDEIRDIWARGSNQTFIISNF